MSKMAVYPAVLAVCLALAAGARAGQGEPSGTKASPGLPAAKPAAPPPAAKLLQIRRLYVEQLGGGDAAGQIRDMIIAGIQRAGLFVITENPDRADAVLRGSAEDLIYTETHDYRDGVSVRGAVSLGSSSRSRSSSRRSGGIYASSTVGQDQSVRSSERRHEATAAVRIVDVGGDVIWSAIGESRGTKFRSASADVARQITEQLLRDYRRVQRQTKAKPASLGRGNPPGRAAPRNDRP